MLNARAPERNAFGLVAHQRNHRQVPTPCEARQRKPRSRITGGDDDPPVPGQRDLFQKGVRRDDIGQRAAVIARRDMPGQDQAACPRHLRAFAPQPNGVRAAIQRAVHRHLHAGEASRNTFANGGHGTRAGCAPYVMPNGRQRRAGDGRRLQEGLVAVVDGGCRHLDQYMAGRRCRWRRDIPDFEFACGGDAYRLHDVGPRGGGNGCRIGNSIHYLNVD